MSENVEPTDWDKFDWHNVQTEHGHLRASKILHLIPKQGKHLDVGTGRGDGTFTISKIKSCIGIDYGLVSTEIAKSKGLEIFQSDARYMPFKSNTFDSVTCLDVLEHIPNPDFAIKEISRVIRDDGIFVLQTPSSEMIKEKLLRFIRKHNIKKQKQPYDLSLKLDDIRNLLSNNNFKVISQEKIKYWDSNFIMQIISYSWVFHCRKISNK